MNKRANGNEESVIKKISNYIIELKNFKKKDAEALGEYMMKDNIRNLFIVSLFLIFTFSVRVVCYNMGIVYSSMGMELLAVAIVYIFVWQLIKSEFIENKSIVKILYISFWVILNLVILKYLKVEINVYSSISYFVIIMFLMSMFLISSLPLAGTLILFATVAACDMINRGSIWNNTKEIYISSVITVAILSVIITQYRYYTYIWDKMARIELKSMSEIDRLTSLLNRRGLDRKLEELWPMLRNMQREVWVIMIDIDHFKSYNDSYGHIAGDKCLEDVSECIYDSASKHTDLIVRYGGEEIVIVLTESNEDECVELAKDISKRVRGLRLRAGEESAYPILTVSIGISNMLANHDNTIYDIINRADEQLYYSKNNGRNIITINSEEVVYN